MANVIALRGSSRPRRKLYLSDKMFIARAWSVVRFLDLPKTIGNARTFVWLQTVAAIRWNSADGAELRFGSGFSKFRSEREFGDYVNACDDDVDILIQRGLLLPLDGGIALPFAWGLRPEAQ